MLHQALYQSINAHVSELPPSRVLKQAIDGDTLYKGSIRVTTHTGDEDDQGLHDITMPILRNIQSLVNAELSHGDYYVVTTGDIATGCIGQMVYTFMDGFTLVITQSDFYLDFTFICYDI